MKLKWQKDKKQINEARKHKTTAEVRPGSCELLNINRSNPSLKDKD